MSPLPVLSATVTVFVRATESEEKVLRALRTVVPEGLGVLERTEAKGVLGNKIVILRVLLRKKSEARKLWKHIWKNIDESARSYLREHLEEHLDEFGRLHLRFHKQEAYMGKLVLSTGGGVIKVVFQLEAYPATPEGFAKALKRLVEGAR